MPSLIVLFSIKKKNQMSSVAVVTSILTINIIP